MKEERLYTKKSWLYQRYWTENLSSQKIGALCGVEGGTIRKHMRRLDIPSRTVSEAHQMGYGVSQFKNRNWLYKKYWKQNHTLREIAALCSRDRTTIRDWFTEFDIPVRTRAEWQARVIEANIKRNHCSLFSRFTGKIKEIVGSFDVYMRVQDN